MEFFDANVIYGLPSESKPTMPVKNTAELQQEMRNAGIRKALVKREEQICAGPVFGNKLLAEDIRDSENLWGIWMMLPPHTHELPEPDNMLQEMKKNRIAAWQFIPSLHRFVFHWRLLKTWFKLAEQKKIPIFIDFNQGISHEDLLAVLEHFPDLILIISIPGVWPLDRIFRPYICEFRNCYVELSNYLCDGGIEDLVGECGAERILFGSAFYHCHFGGMMLTLKHAKISKVEKAMIAGKNLERLIGEIEYD